MKSEVVACLDYDVEVLARGTDEVRHMLAELEADHSKGKLQYDTTCSADVTMPTRASVPHFVDLLRDQDIAKLVRITPVFSARGNGHLVALGLGGFFLCTSLKLLVDGLGCRLGIRAMMGRDVGFDGACLAPRWRKSETPWTMDALAAKPATLVSGSTGHSAGQQATTTAPDVFTPSSANVRGPVYSNSVAFGKEVAEICGPIHTIEGHTRVLETVKNYMRQVVAVEVRSQSNASSSRVFRGAASQSARRGGGGVGQRQQGGGGRGGQRGSERGGGTGGGINKGLGEDEVAGRGSSSGVGGQALPQTPTPQVTSHAVAAAAAASLTSPALDSPAQYALNTPPPTQPVPSAAVQMAAAAPRFAATAAVGAASPVQHALPATTPPTQPVPSTVVQQAAAARSAAAAAVGAASPAQRSLLITTPTTPSVPSAFVQQAAAAARFAATAVGSTPLPHTLPSPVALGAAAAAAALQTAPTCGRGHPPATHGTDVLGRSYALLQFGANGAIAGHGGGGPPGSAGDGMIEKFARATSNMVRTSTLSAEGCCRLQPTGKHNNRPPSVANRMTWLFLGTCVRPNTRGHADRARGTQQGQLVGAEDVQRKGLVNNCGRLRLGSLLFFVGLRVAKENLRTDGVVVS